MLAPESGSTAVLMNFNFPPFQWVSAEAPSTAPPSAHKPQWIPCLFRAISSDPLLVPSHLMHPHQLSPPHSLTVTPSSPFFSALAGISLARSASGLGLPSSA